MHARVRRRDLVQRTTADGTAVTAASPATDPDSFTVTVGSDTLFTGSVAAVIDRAAGVTP